MPPARGYFHAGDAHFRGRALKLKTDIERLSQGPENTAAQPDAGSNSRDLSGDTEVEGDVDP